MDGATGVKGLKRERQGKKGNGTGSAEEKEEGLEEEVEEEEDGVSPPESHSLSPLHLSCVFFFP